MSRILQICCRSFEAARTRFRPAALLGSLTIFFLFTVTSVYFTPLLSGCRPGIAAAHAESGDSKSEKKKKKSKKKGEEDEEEADKPKGTEERHDHRSFDRDLNEEISIDAVLVLDSSRSMLRNDPKRLRDQGAKLLGRLLGESDRVALMQFDRDVKVLSEFVEIKPESVSEIDKTIEGIAAEGGFTDLEAPLAAAFEMLVAKGRPKAVKAVILLSDGKMDPHPSVGTPQEATDRTLKDLLPKYRRKGVKLYTMAFSDESDAELLGKFAADTNGIHWTAKDVETIHAKFSELFLALKKPQVTPVEKGGFEIDASVKEATFYITRKEAGQQVTLLSPDGTEISSTDFPPGAKWFHGEMFDVITIKSPGAGTWFIHGVDKPEGFASLLTDIKLQVKWPEAGLGAGDRVVFFARLTEKGEVLSPKGIGELTFFSYKIVDAKDESSAAAELNDKGEDGDTKAGDGIFSATTRLPEEGEFNLIVSATGPTFSRQQRIPFNIAGGVISLGVVPGDEFEGKEEQLVVKLKGDALLIKGPKVAIVFKEKEGEKSYTLTPKAAAESKGEFILPASKVPKGTFEAVAKVSGIPKGKKELKAASPPIEYVGAGPEESPDQPTEEGGADESGTSLDTILGLIFLVLALGWAGGGGFYVFKHSPLEKGVPSGREPYVVPDELTARIKAIRDKSSAEKRQATNADLAVFQIVAEALGPIDLEAAEAPQQAVNQEAPKKEEGWEEPPAEAAQ